MGDLWRSSGVKRLIWSSRILAGRSSDGRASLDVAVFVGFLRSVRGAMLACRPRTPLRYLRRVQEDHLRCGRERSTSQNPQSRRSAATRRCARTWWRSSDRRRPRRPNHTNPMAQRPQTAISLPTPMNLKTITSPRIEARGSTPASTRPRATVDVQSRAKVVIRPPAMDRRNQADHAAVSATTTAAISRPRRSTASQSV